MWKKLFQPLDCFCYFYEGDNDECPKHGAHGRLLRDVLVMMLFTVLAVAGLVLALMKGA